MKFLLVPALLLSSLATDQTPVIVKPSPASDALVKIAQDLQTQQKSFDVILQQAQSTATSNQKQLQTDIQKANTDLLAELKADKKYKDKLAAIDTMQKQLNTVAQTAQQKFQQDTGPIQTEIAKDKVVIDGLIPIVRKENDLPATATFDPATQKWTVPKDQDKPADSKK